jgi:hypothetical protein
MGVGQASGRGNGGSASLDRRPKKLPPRELVHTAAIAEALRHRCDIEEEPMSDLAARFVYAPLLSTTFKVVCLFCVFGLALSAVIIPMIAPDYLIWVLSHIE